jgi:hypothetical protein
MLSDDLARRPRSPRSVLRRSCWQRRHRTSARRKRSVSPPPPTDRPWSSSAGEEHRRLVAGGGSAPRHAHPDGQEASSSPPRRSTRGARGLPASGSFRSETEATAFGTAAPGGHRAYVEQAPRLSVGCGTGLGWAHPRAKRRRLYRSKPERREHLVVRGRSAERQVEAVAKAARGSGPAMLLRGMSISAPPRRAGRAACSWLGHRSPRCIARPGARGIGHTAARDGEVTPCRPSSAGRRGKSCASIC